MIGNIGGVYNDTFGVVDVDLMLVLDRSGSMAWNVTNATNGAVNSTSSTGWSWVKNMTVAAKNGNTANLTVELRSSVANCLSSYEARINGVPVSNGSTNSTSSSYVALYSSINISSIEPPYTVSLWLKRNATSGCSAYTRLLSVQQLPAKMSAAQSAAKTFLEISGHATYAGLVSFSTTSNKDKSIAEMTPANLASLESAINGLSASGSTCIECGLDSAADELTSSRARPTANKVIVMLTDGVGNYAKDGSSCSTPSCGIAWSVAAAEYCRDRNITVYTIGFGDDVNDEELTDIALLTHGDYYFAPNVETLNDIFMNIGR